MGSNNKQAVMNILSKEEQVEFLDSLKKYVPYFKRVIWWNKLINTPDFYKDIPAYEEGDYVALAGKYGFSHRMPIKKRLGMNNTHEAYVNARLDALILDIFVVSSNLGVYWQVTTASKYEACEDIY